MRATTAQQDGARRPCASLSARMTAMESVFPPPVATPFEAVAAIVSAAVYLIVRGAALAYAPRHIRVRLFFATALASAGPYWLTVLLWVRRSHALFPQPLMSA